MPVQVVKILEFQRAIVRLGGIEKDISTALLEFVSVGDYIILHAGYALTKLNEQDAQKTLLLFSEMMQGISVE